MSRRLIRIRKSGQHVLASFSRAFGPGGALLVMALAGCAQDAWKPDPNYSAFLNTVERNCGTARIGELTVSQLLNPSSAQSSAYFLDLTSRYDTGRVSTEEYVIGVSSTFNTVQDSAGIKCIVAQKVAQ